MGEHLNLSFDGVLKTPSFENNRKSNTITHCVDLFLCGSFEDMGIFFFRNLYSKGNFFVW